MKNASTQSSTARDLKYIASSNTLIKITVTPLGGSPNTYGPSACTTASCTISFTTTPGPNTLEFILTDGSSNILSSFSTTNIIQPSTINTLSFTATSTRNAGTPANDVLTVSALSVNNAQAGGRGSVTLQGPSDLSAPNHAIINAHYDGGRLSASTISVSSSLPIAGTLGNATLTTVPVAQEYATTTSNSQPNEIITGPDGNIWFTDFGNNKIGKITQSGTITEYGTGITASAGLYGITVGPDGNIWFTEFNNSAIGRYIFCSRLSHYVLMPLPRELAS
jgi:hypothetical protein